ncbi:hypothetical protein ACQQ2Q_04435 [Agrobacterium sp. ES01]|uniref:hypothetical protein n=1 Tax=Agrobacterium sp. ES01 TaxID=3420714 RepID=UPI003D12E91E
MTADMDNRLRLLRVRDSRRIAHAPLRRHFKSTDLEPPEIRRNGRPVVSSAGNIAIRYYII